MSHAPEKPQVLSVEATPEQQAQPARWLGRLVRPLPCPACGDEIEYDEELHFNGGGPPPSYQVRCGYCGASGPYGHGARRDDHDGGRNDAINLWNAMPRRPNTKVTNSGA
jgi:hypothetical protein